MPETPDVGERGGSAQPRRRQARGERRVAQLLEAAAGVFCRSGYTAASTNAIAREAGVSPGTLYQFFPNKEAIAVELGGRLMQRWRETHGAAFDTLDPSLPLDELLDSVLDPLIEFNCENPAFAVLMHGSEIPGRITEEHDAVHSALLERVERLLGDFLPEAGPAELSRVANMTFSAVKAGLELVLAHEGAQRDAYRIELKAMVHRYLQPLVDAAPQPENTRIDTP
ncbi:TetR/AcrR family transcriptional regulator [Streptomyces sp. HNM0645]|uniref:TetR/AcrR family transcriptional regulator n=1 Tax=Streptomyces sp. HNM0645 TaxID=2782343 RepID=UPI0024B7EA90|nr:TetR/AcrR family transcriptional regulator [Streptomyces sp. HNM0645]MDI9884581.1 TetR/AcrR family transcriptional regulator [Streptomyces sp. HNM0645]